MLCNSISGIDGWPNVGSANDSWAGLANQLMKDVSRKAPKIQTFGKK